MARTSIIVDTPIWSGILRRRDPESGLVARMQVLIASHMVFLIGPIRQELLSGIKDERQFARVEQGSKSFPDLPLEPVDFVNAAKNHNACMKAGIQGSAVDFLLCAIAQRTNSEIATWDKDFESYAKVLPIKLYKF